MPDLPVQLLKKCDGFIHGRKGFALLTQPLVTFICVFQSGQTIRIRAQKTADTHPIL